MKIASRKFFAFMVWVVMMILQMRYKFTIADAWVNGFSIVTALYIGGQSAIDFFEKKEK